jgi:hypothetical protein
MGNEKKTPMSASLLHEMFKYEDGRLYYKDKLMANGKPSPRNGKLVNTPNGSGYISVVINKVQYKVHRLIFLMFHGYLPTFIDHADGNRSNNRIENLREATRAQNNYNAKLRSDNTSGVKGVSWHRQNSKWCAYINADNKRLYVGLFSTIEDAANAVAVARLKNHKNFYNHGV